MKQCPRCGKYMNWKLVRTATSWVEKWVCLCGYESIDAEVIYTSNTSEYKNSVNRLSWSTNTSE